MKDSFFIAPSNKRKRQDRNNKNKNKSMEKKDDDEYSDVTDPDFRVGDLDDLDLEHDRLGDTNEEDENTESAQEKRVRLAKEYLQRLKDQQTSKSVADGGFDAAEIDRELIESRLRKDALESEGIIRRKINKDISENFVTNLKLIKGFGKCMTSAVSTPDDLYLYCGSKDGNIYKCDLLTGKRMAMLLTPNGTKPHPKGVSCLAISFDGRFLASGGRGTSVCIWENDQMVHEFKQHRDDVTGLAFRKGPTNCLYSSSADRTVKVYNIDEMSYVETLFGHQEAITGLDSMGFKERCLTTGGRDRTVRQWKIVEESQLVFRVSSGKVVSNNYEKSEPGYYHFVDETGSVDCVAFVNNDCWVSGSDGGTLSLWHPNKKKPIVSVPNAHGRTVIVSSSEEAPDLIQVYPTTISPQIQHLQSDLDTIEAVEETVRGKPFVSNANWITSVSSVCFSNLIASGSHDGKVRFWMICRPEDSDEDETKSSRTQLKQIASLTLAGYVNSLKFSQSGRYLIAACGQEHRHGRWQKIKGSRNMVAIIKLPENIFE